MKDNNALSWVCSGVTILTSTLSHDILQIILMVLGVISALVSLAYNIYVWYKKAKQDGKIDRDEIDDLMDILNDSKKGGKKK